MVARMPQVGGPSGILVDRLKHHRSLSSIDESSSSSNRSVGFDLDSNQVHQGKTPSNPDTWYTTYELDSIRFSYHQIARHAKRGLKERKGCPHRGTEGDEKCKATMSRSKEVVLKNQKRCRPEALADIYKTLTEESQQKALKLAAEDETFVEGIRHQTPTNRTLKRLLKVFTM